MTSRTMTDADLTARRDELDAELLDIIPALNREHDDVWAAAKARHREIERELKAIGQERTARLNGTARMVSVLEPTAPNLLAKLDQVLAESRALVAEAVTLDADIAVGAAALADARGALEFDGARWRALHERRATVHALLALNTHMTRSLHAALALLGEPADAEAGE